MGSHRKSFQSKAFTPLIRGTAIATIRPMGFACPLIQ
jgi:hypothetical protein